MQKRKPILFMRSLLILNGIIYTFSGDDYSIPAVWAKPPYRGADSIR